MFAAITGWWFGTAAGSTPSSWCGRPSWALRVSFLAVAMALTMDMVISLVLVVVVFVSSLESHLLRNRATGNLVKYSGLSGGGPVTLIDAVVVRQFLVPAITSGAAPRCSIMLCHRGQTLSNWSMLVVVCLRWMADLWKFPTFWPSEWTTSMPSCHLRLSSCMDRSKRRIIVLKLCWRPGSLTFGVCCPCVWERKVNDGVGASHLVGAVSGLLLCLFTGLWWLWCPTLFSWWWG